MKYASVVMYVLLSWAFTLTGHCEDITVNGLPVTLLGNKAGAQKTLFVLSKSRMAVQSRPEELAPVMAALLKKRWMIVLVDLPGTGTDQRPGELDGDFVYNVTTNWRTRMEKGENVIEDFSKKLSAVVDRLVVEKLVNPRFLYIYGRGEGGILALDAIASDSRFIACALEAPITDLRFIANFQENDELSDKIQKTLAAKNKAEELSSRSIRIWMTARDHLNDTTSAIDFMGSIYAGSDNEMFIRPGIYYLDPERSRPITDYLLTQGLKKK